MSFTTYGLVSDINEEYKWTGKLSIPKVGDKLKVVINGIGEAVVQSYFVECKYLGAIVKPLNPPKWYISQNGKNAVCHVFGAEVTSA